MKMNKNAILLVALVLSGCTISCVKNPPAAISHTDFEVLNTDSGSQPADNFCAGFSLTVNQAEAFFNRGKEIDAIYQRDSLGSNFSSGFTIAQRPFLIHFHH